jgi:hypothetical protein
MTNCQRCHAPVLAAEFDPTLPVWCRACEWEFRERMSDGKIYGCDIEGGNDGIAYHGS